MLIIGHRGAAGLATENTIGSLQKAIEFGVDMLEVDLRADKDGKIVLAHDEDPGKNYTGAVSLKEALSVMSIPVNLEIKESGFEEELVKIVKEFPSKVLISSFKLSVLMKVRTLDRNIKLGLIISPKIRFHFFFSFMVLVSALFKFHSIHPHSSLLTDQRVKFIHRMGAKVFTWVINTQESFEALKKMNVDGVFTDHPDIIRK